MLAPQRCTVADEWPDARSEMPLSPTTATINAFDAITAKSGNRDLSASKFANSSRTRSVLGAVNMNVEPLKTPTIERAPSFHDKIIDRIRKENGLSGSVGAAKESQLGHGGWTEACTWNALMSARYQCNRLQGLCRGRG
jgi:hypothetical protein